MVVFNIGGDYEVELSCRARVGLVEVERHLMAVIELGFDHVGMDLFSLLQVWLVTEFGL